MKKYILFLCAVLFTFFLVGCIAEVEDNEEMVSFDQGDYVINFEDSAAFEKALNDGEKVKGKKCFSVDSSLRRRKEIFV